jgi:hypothetical protein
MIESLERAAGTGTISRDGRVKLKNGNERNQ